MRTTIVHKLSVVLSVCMLLLVLVAAAASAGPPSDSPPSQSSSEPELVENTDPEGSDAAQVAADLGISEAEAREALARQDDVGQLEAALEAHGPASFGGVIIEYQPSYHLRVLASPGNSRQVREAVEGSQFADLLPYVRVEETPYTRGTLMRAMAQVRQLGRGRITTLDVDIRTGAVIATAATSADVATVRAAVASERASIPAADVRIEQGGFEEEVASYGGLNMNSPNGNCTSGFSVRRTTDNAEGISDAAHCPNSSVSLNSVTLDFVDGKWSGDQDVQWFKTPGMDDPNKIKDSSTTTRSITARVSRSEMSVGGAVCHYGRTTGYGCGSVASKDYDASAISTHSHNATFIRVTDDNTDPGDSGCPWFLGIGAHGIHKGATSGGDPVFMAQNFMSALNLVVKISP
jgi:streptogrisin C